MVKDHFDSEKGNPLPPHRLLFPISSKGSFICTIPLNEQSDISVWMLKYEAMAISAIIMDTNSDDETNDVRLSLQVVVLNLYMV